MTYGLEILNDYGVPVFDTTHPCLVVKYSGLTQSMDRPLPSPTGFAPHWEFLGGAGSYVALPGGMVWDLDRGPSTDTMIKPVIPANASPQDTVFYQLGTTWCVYAIEVVTSLDPGFGIPEACMGVTTIPDLPFKVVGPITDAEASTGWGMQIFGDAGELLFDSNCEFLAIRYSFIVPQAVIDDILANGTSVDVTLPEAMPDCWIACPIWSHQEYGLDRVAAGPTYYYLRRYVEFSQVDASTIRLRRRQTEEAWGTPRTTFAYSHDAIFYVARNIP